MEIDYVSLNKQIKMLIFKYENVCINKHIFPSKFSDSYPNVTITPSVSAHLKYAEFGDSKFFANLTVFRCKFDASEIFYYDVFWNVNGYYVTDIKNKNKIEMLDTDLLQTHWRPNFTMNMEVG